MKLSAALIGSLAAFAAANALCIPKPAGIDSLLDIYKQINESSGVHTIKSIAECILKDSTWKVDYLDQKNGKVTFSSVTNECCGMALAGWNKYRGEWAEYAQASFNSPCDGGQLSNMTEQHINLLHTIIGDGH